MTAAEPVDVAVNPNDPTQFYVLWGNGRVDNFGGCPPITSAPNWYNRVDQPVGVAIAITDWATGQGYVLDIQGGVQQLNGAAALGSGTGQTGQGQSGIDCTALGLPYVTTPVHSRTYVDWSWDPGGSGHFVVVDVYGQLYNVNGANAPTRTGHLWASAGAPRKLAVNWSAGQPAGAAILDYSGGIHGNYGTAFYPVTMLWPGWKAAHDFVVTDWTSFSGYILDLYGGVNDFGGATAVHGFPYKKADVARCLAVLSTSNPLKMLEIWSGGQQFQFVSSGAPTVTAGGLDPVSPAATVTTTTRPVLAWSYGDPDGDAQNAWEVYVFTQAFANANNMSNPETHASGALVALSGIDSGQRGVVADYDFPDGTYRLFVRAQDRSGRWSAWSTLDWTQDVPSPTSPSGLRATFDATTASVALSVSGTTGGSADTVAFGYSDDGGDTWGLVRGADAVPLASTTTATDRDIPCGVTRMYRAVTYNSNPRVVSADSNTDSVTSTVHRYFLQSADDASLGGEVKVVDPPSWTRSAKAGVFAGAGAEFPTVVSDGIPKARTMTLGIEADLTPAVEMIEALIASNGTLVYRDPFGLVAYCRVVGDWTKEQIRRFPAADEATPLRNSHKFSIPLTEVAQPTTLDLSNTVPPGPAD